MDRHGNVRFWPILAPLTGYPSRASKIVDNYLRDRAIVLLMAHVKEGWPRTPMRNSTRRGGASAAMLVGLAFGLSERQAKRIYQGDKGQAQRLAAFLASRPFGPLSNGPLLKELARR